MRTDGHDEFIVVFRNFCKASKNCVRPERLNKMQRKTDRQPLFFRLSSYHLAYIQAGVSECSIAGHYTSLAFMRAK
jgi:hypothetical protein